MNNPPGSDSKTGPSPVTRPGIFCGGSSSTSCAARVANGNGPATLGIELFLGGHRRSVRGVFFRGLSRGVESFAVVFAARHRAVGVRGDDPSLVGPVADAGGGRSHRGVDFAFGQKWSTAGKSADYMEAVVLGTGVIRVRATS